MGLPAYIDLITLSSTNGGLVSESLQERLLTVLAMLASGTGPDGTALPAAGAIPLSVSYVGDGSGNHTNATTVMADLGAQYSVTIAAAVSDVITAQLVVTAANNTLNDGVQMQWVSVNNANAALNPLANFTEMVAGNVFGLVCVTRLVVAAGDISGGNVVLKPQFAAVTGGTATVVNEAGASGARRPFILVTNWKH